MLTRERTVNKTDGVWAVELARRRANVSLDGVALGPHEVAKL